MDRIERGLFSAVFHLVESCKSCLKAFDLT